MMEPTREWVPWRSRARSAACLALLTLGGCQTSWSPLFDETADFEALRSIPIAATSEALTFARDATGQQAYAVVTYDAELVTAVALDGADPIAIFLAQGYDALAQRIDEAVASGATVSLAAGALGLPVDLGAHHVAAGTNFPEHATETGVTEGPYLFPKLTAPTRYDAPVALSHGGGLLDYEVELGFVALEPIADGEAPAHVGLVICNDYTDRDTLLRNLDPDDVESGDGFTTGKSFPGYLPIGNLFVIPRDVRAFADTLELRLYVNGGLRQRELAGRAIWRLDDLIRETFARRERTWEHRGAAVTIVAGDRSVIPARTILMSGTPPGVVFNELTIEQKGSGLFDLIFGGWDRSLPDHAIDNYIRDARAAGIYLDPATTCSSTSSGSASCETR
jgi:2,4-diketo-3-deoxy-L-fuconate hydrolase